MIYRQKRFYVNSLGVKAVFAVEGSDPVIGSVENISAYGAKIKVSELDFLGFYEDPYVEIKCGAYELYSGNYRVIKKDLDTLLVSWESGSTKMETLKAIENLPEVKSESDYAISDLVDPKFKETAADFMYLLAIIHDELSEIETQNSLYVGNELAELTKLSIDKAELKYKPLIETCFQSFHGIMNTVDDNDHVTQYKKYFRKIFNRLTYNVPFLKRALEKPLGYAGDYGLMVMLYEYQDMGNTLFEKFFHRVVCTEGAAEANKNRVHLLSNQILEEIKGRDSFKISVIACGPCREIELALSTIVKWDVVPKLEIFCADQESGALDYAMERLYRLTCDQPNIKLRMIQGDIVLGMIKRKGEIYDYMDQSDMVISAGLFDYLSDRVSQKLISAMVSATKPGGQVIVGNVSTFNPSQFPMSFFSEWELILRSEEDLRLLPENSVQESCQLEVLKEPLAVNLFLSIRLSRV